MQTAYS